MLGFAVSPRSQDTSGNIREEHKVLESRVSSVGLYLMQRKRGIDAVVLGQVTSSLWLGRVHAIYRVEAVRIAGRH